MRSRRIAAFCFTALMMLWSAAAFAQQATINGTVTDDTKAVRPGATITATNLATGVQVLGVSDERGEFRVVNLPPGMYKVQVDLAGFSSVVVPSIELLVGQNATMPFALKVAQLSETVTVSSESPLVDVTSSQVAGNVNPRPMEELPLQGRNWLELSKLVKMQLIGEVYNLFNHANYTGYVTQLSATSAATTARFGLPSAASIPRQGQLAFRLAWK
jgi:hypothetical protein